MHCLKHGKERDRWSWVGYGVGNTVRVATLGFRDEVISTLGIDKYDEVYSCCKAAVNGNEYAIAAVDCISD